MKCSNCNKEINEEMNFCPVCGNALRDDDEEIILPQLAKENDFDDEETREYNFDFEETQKIDPLAETKTITSLPSLIDDINNQIELVNLESSTSEKDGDGLSAEDKIDSMIENVPEKDNRKKYLIIAGVSALVIILVFSLIFGLFRKDKEEKVENYDHISLINESLDKYYESDGDSYSEIVDVLKKIYKDEDKLDEVREETKTKIDEWINDYFDNESVNSQEFLNITEKYKSLIDTLYEKAVYDNVKLLMVDDYNEFINKIDDIYADSKSYYEAVDYYAEQSYNDAYYMFSKVENSSKFYEKAINAQGKIVNDVITSIKKDISKIESNVENKSDEEKLNIYTQIEDIILKYDRVYYNLEFSNKSEYSTLLETYRSKISEYNGKVVETEKNKAEENQQESSENVTPEITDPVVEETTTQIEESITEE